MDVPEKNRTETLAEEYRSDKTDSRLRRGENEKRRKAKGDEEDSYRVVEDGAKMYMTAWTKAFHAEELFAIPLLEFPQFQSRTSGK